MTRDHVGFKRMQSALYQAKKRAAKVGVPFEITVEDLPSPERCPALGLLLDYGPKGRHGPNKNSPSVDRIDPDLGYVSGNVVVISTQANRIKSNGEAYEISLVAEWLRTIEKGDAA